MIRVPTLVTAVAVTLMSAPAVQAHPKFSGGSPAANATVASPKHITLRFTEKLVSKFSKADLVMTDMPGMKMNAPMKMAATSMVMGDGKTLMVMPTKPLPAGTYKLSYRVVASDTHPVTGGYTFKVK